MSRFLKNLNNLRAGNSDLYCYTMVEYVFTAKRKTNGINC